MVITTSNSTCPLNGFNSNTKTIWFDTIDLFSLDFCIFDPTCDIFRSFGFFTDRACYGQRKNNFNLQMSDLPIKKLKKNTQRIDTRKSIPHYSIRENLTKLFDGRSQVLSSLPTACEMSNYKVIVWRRSWAIKVTYAPLSVLSRASNKICLSNRGTETFGCLRKFCEKSKNIFSTGWNPALYIIPTVITPNKTNI